MTTQADPANPGRFIRTPFANNVIPAIRIPRPSRLLANLYPDPNAGVNQFFFSPNRVQNDDAFNVRSDKVMAANKNNLFVRVSRGSDVTNLPGAMPAPANPGFTIGAYAGGDTAQLC